MTKELLYDFIKQHRLAVLATMSNDHIPESALVGIAITPDLKIIFDTVSDSRKYNNLIHNPNISFVIGWDHEKTVQYEGIAKIPNGNELDHLLEIYFETFPDGPERKANWKNIVYFCAERKWIHYSDFNEATKEITEIRF